MLTEQELQAEIATLAVSIIRTIDESKLKEEECWKLSSVDSGSREAVLCRREVRALRQRAKKMLQEYQLLRDKMDALKSGNN